MKKFLSILLVGIFLIAGCQTIPKDALTLSHESLVERQMQTRKYETTDERKILTVSAELLQDMGFNIDESETKLGLITASKQRSAVNAGQVFAAVVVAALVVV
jgi:hypothetical protein